MLKRIWQALWEATRRYFVAGLLAFAPIGVTIWAIAFIITRLDNLLLPRVMALFFGDEVGRTPDIPPFVGAIFTFAVILLAGVIVRHFFGHEFVRLSERLLSRVPVASSIYVGVKQLFEAVLTDSATQSFNRVVIVEYPRKGIYGLAFVTGSTRGSVQRALPDSDLVNCFIPTTPNPTSGFYLMIPRDEIYEVDMTVEDAFKVIMSAGLVTPPGILAPPKPRSDRPLPAGEGAATGGSQAT